MAKVDNNYFKSPKEGKTILPEMELTRKIKNGFLVATAMLEAGNSGVIPSKF